MPSFQDIRPDRAPTRGQPDTLVVLIDRDTDAKALPEPIATLDRAAGGAIAAAMRRAEFSADSGATTVLYLDDPQSKSTAPGSKATPGSKAAPGSSSSSSQRPASRIVLAGLGPGERVDARAVTTAAAAATRTLRDAKAKRVRFELPKPLIERLGADQLGAAIGFGLTSASFTFEQYKGAAAGKRGKPLPALSVSVPGALAGALSEALIAGHAANTARALGATPPNVADPVHLAARCRALAKQMGLSCKVIDAAAAKRLKMGGLLAVGAGGSKPPRVIVLEWEGDRQAKPTVKKKTGKPSAARATRPDPILLVGKAITFDTGGYSLKVGGTMKGMKYDKCGGAAVIGIMEALARLKVKQRVIALIACAENMVDTDAYRVDDILTLANGVTVEVTNTDAEGRLVLADALAYGTKVYRPKAVLDLATLTGGVRVALGTDITGAWCLDEALWQRVQRAGERTGERAWRLPLDHGYRDMMKSNHADLHNAAAVREAHATQGAAFLSYFVGEDAPRTLPTIPWCHLDIAGTATRDDNSPLYDKGPTGFGVRLVADLIAHW